MASRQSLILLDILPPYSKWTHFTLGVFVRISTVMHVPGDSLEHNEKSRGYSAVTLSYWVILIHGCLPLPQTPRLHLSQLSHCKPRYNCGGHSITEPLQSSMSSTLDIYKSILHSLAWKRSGRFWLRNRLAVCGTAFREILEPWWLHTFSPDK